MRQWEKENHKDTKDTKNLNLLFLFFLSLWFFLEAMLINIDFTDIIKGLLICKRQSLATFHLQGKRG